MNPRTPAQLPLLAAIALSLLAALGFAQPDRQIEQTATSHSNVITNSVPSVRFESVDIYVDSGKEPLAAYQFELNAPAEPGFQAVIVGVEGGEHPAYAAAPYYDPAALQHQRIIIAAFSLADELPTGRTRVARLHMQIRPLPAAEKKRADQPAPASAPAERLAGKPAGAPPASPAPASAQPVRPLGSGPPPAAPAKPPVAYAVQLMTAASRDGAPAKASATLTVSGGTP